LKQKDEFVVDFLGRVRTGDQITEDARRFIRLTERIVDLVHEPIIQKKTSVHFPITYGHASSAFRVHIAGPLNVALILQACTVAHLALKEEDQAIESCQLLFRMASWNPGQPELNCALSDVVTFHIAMETFQSVAARCRLTEEQLSRISESSTRVEIERNVRRAFQGAACSLFQTFEEAIPSEAEGEGVPIPLEVRTYYLEDIRHALDAIGDGCKLLKVNWLPAQEELTKLQARINQLPFLSARFIPDLNASIRAMWEQIAMVRLLGIAIELLHLRNRKGSLPGDLADLSPVFLKSIPPDPFTEKAFLFRDRRLYSVGCNGKDDGGKRGGDKGEYDDVVFEFK